MDALVLATDRDLPELAARCRVALEAQSTRLVAQLAGLRPEQWAAPSRNQGWTVHQTVQHVTGTRVEAARRLRGDAPRWTGFDPNRTPQEDIDTRADEPPSVTISSLASASDELLSLLDLLGEPRPRLDMVWGEPADAALFVSHLLWDAFIHEHDVLVPLSMEPRPTDTELLLAVLHGLLLAAVPLRMNDGSLATSVTVDGVGVATIDCATERIVVELTERGPAGQLRAASAARLVDALSGRGDPADVLEGPEGTVAALTGFGRYLASGDR